MSPRLQPVQAFTEAHTDRDQVPEDPRSPWLTTDEACVYLRYHGKHRLRSLYRFLSWAGIPKGRRGPRRILIARRDLDRALRYRLGGSHGR
jgi:hypothetical protein